MQPLDRELLLVYVLLSFKMAAVGTVDTLATELPVVTSSLPVYLPSPHEGMALPHFLEAPTIVQVQSGDRATLECRVTSLAKHHTVSWIRSHDISVLTVGGLVFSSDPRISVLSYPRPGHSLGRWTLAIEKTQTGDAGSYRCQVNTEPARSKSYTLVVEERLEDPVQTVQTVFISDDTVRLGDKEEKQSRSVASSSEGEVTEEEEVRDDKVSLEQQGSSASPLLERTEEEEEEKVVSVSSVPSTLGRPPSLGPPSLLVPVLSLFSLTMIVLAIGSVRGLYRKCHPATLPPSRTKPRSRAGSGDSRRSREGTLRRQRKEQESGRMESGDHLEKEESLYEPFPLVQVQPIPTKQRPGPAAIFSLTGDQESIGSSDYSVCYSDATLTSLRPPPSLSSLQRPNSLHPSMCRLASQETLVYADSRPCIVGQDSGARSQESGARSHESGARSQESGARSPGSLTSTDTILEPVGTLLCGNVRLSLQKEVLCDSSPAYLPTNHPSLRGFLPKEAQECRREGEGQFRSPGDQDGEFRSPGDQEPRMVVTGVTALHLPSMVASARRARRLAGGEGAGAGETGGWEGDSGEGGFELKAKPRDGSRERRLRFNPFDEFSD